jgi:hypothetical protein
MGPLLRIGVWGACALIAVGATVFTARTEVGTKRAGAALAALREAPKDMIVHPNELLAARTREDDERARELAETVRSLTADRDHLASRLAALERNLTDLTSSVSHPAPPPSADSVPTDPPASRPADDKSDAARPLRPTRQAPPQRAGPRRPPIGAQQRFRPTCQRQCRGQAPLRRSSPM